MVFIAIPTCYNFCNVFYYYFCFSWIKYIRLVNLVTAAQICWRTRLRLSERLASLGIMEAKLRALFKALNTSVLWCVRDFRETLNWDPTMPKDAKLSDSCTFDCCFFPVGLSNIIIIIWASSSNILVYRSWGSPAYIYWENISLLCKTSSTFFISMRIFMGLYNIYTRKNGVWKITSAIFYM